MAWTTPKTDWKGTDTFDTADWDRISYNVKYIAEAVGLYYTPVTVYHQRTLITSRQRTLLTNRLEEIYATMGASWNRGYVAPRVDYGSPWNSKDLNIIENMLLDMKRQLDGEISGNVEYYAGSEIYCGDDISVGLL